MKLHNLKPAEGGGVKKKRRVGRGYGSGDSLKLISCGAAADAGSTR